LASIAADRAVWSHSRTNHAAVNEVIMRTSPSLRDCLNGVAPQVRRAALALPLILLAGQPAAAQTEPKARGEAREELERRVMDITNMFQKDPRYSRGKTPEQIKDGVEFVTGNVLFVLGHETGHALIREMDIPVLGKEEDAADALATVVSVKMSNAFADRVVINAARGWFLSEQRDRKDGVPTVYYDEHGMDLQRAYNIVCLLVGAQPEKFKGLANEVKLPEERQRTCKDDYNNAAWSWEQALKPHKRKPDDPKTKIEVNYGPPGEFANLAELGRKLQILESVALWLSEDFVWKKPIAIEMQQCGDPGARFEWATHKIVVCYELIREFSQLFRNYGQMALVPGTMKMSKNKKYEVAQKSATNTKNVKSGKRQGQKAYRASR
jgi:hypothetical protein